MSKNLSALFLFVLLLNTAFASTTYAGLFGSTHEAQDFAALSVKLFAKTEDADNFMFSLGSKAEPAYAKGNKAMQKLATELGSEEAAKKAMSKLMNSEFGKKALAEWGSEDAIKYYAKMYEKYGVQSAERYSSKFPSEEVGTVMNNLNELEQLKFTGYESLERDVIFRARSGINHEVAAIKLFKDKGYTLLGVNKILKAGTEDIGQIDSIFIAKGKNVTAELKEGVDSVKYASDEEFAQGLKKQLQIYKEFAAQKNLEEVWLVYRDTIPQAYKDYAESLGVKVFRERELP